MSFITYPLNKKVVEVIKPGTAFTILNGTNESYFKVELLDGKVGYVPKAYTMINLPDIIPSIVYYPSNSISSMFRSNQTEISDLTGNKLYNVKAFNARFNEVQYVMPVLYSMAIKIQAAQNEALANGDSLKIYETFRPAETQSEVATKLSKLMYSNMDVYRAINTAPWSQDWFIASCSSNHQKGRAMDCSLVKVLETETRQFRKATYSVVTSYEEYTMPSAMHELSPAAATFTCGVSKTAWQYATLSDGMLASEGAQRLQKYCTSNGLTPLASEWWHFDDLESNAYGLGGFYLLGGGPDEDGEIHEVFNNTSRRQIHFSKNPQHC